MMPTGCVRSVDAELNRRQRIDRCHAHQFIDGYFFMNGVGSFGIRTMGDRRNATATHESVPIVDKWFSADRQLTTRHGLVRRLKCLDQRTLLIDFKGIASPVKDTFDLSSRFLCNLFENIAKLSFDFLNRGS